MRGVLSELDGAVVIYSHYSEWTRILAVTVLAVIVLENLHQVTFIVGVCLSAAVFPLVVLVDKSLLSIPYILPVGPERHRMHRIATEH